MQFEAWKTALIKEIETAAESRAELALVDPDDPQFGKSQKALFDLAEQLRALSPDRAALKALFNEEAELSNLMRATLGEPERRYRDARQAAHRIEHKPSNNVIDVTFRRACQVRLRRHRLFELMGDLGCIACADAEAHEHVAFRQDQAPDLRVELIDVLMLALHNVSKYVRNSDGWIASTPNGREEVAEAREALEYRWQARSQTQGRAHGHPALRGPGMGCAP